MARTTTHILAIGQKFAVFFLPGKIHTTSSSSTSPLDSLAKFVPLSCSRSSFRLKKKSLWRRRRNTREKALGCLKSCWVPQPLEGLCNSLSERERERSLPLTKIRMGEGARRGFTYPPDRYPRSGDDKAHTLRSTRPVSISRFGFNH